MNKDKPLKDVKLKLVSELLKNSRRSDRELAKAIGVSQPTVTRTMKKLEKEGVIREYTIIPDFTKIGYHIAALTFAKFRQQKDFENMRTAIEMNRESLSEIPEVIMIERGLGPHTDGVVVSLHEDYSSYVDFQNRLKQFSSMGVFDVHPFIIDLDDETHYRALTFSTLAKHIFTLKRGEEEGAGIE